MSLAVTNTQKRHWFCVFRCYQTKQTNPNQPNKKPQTKNHLSPSTLGSLQVSYRTVEGCIRISLNHFWQATCFGDIKFPFCNMSWKKKQPDEQTGHFGECQALPLLLRPHCKFTLILETHRSGTAIILSIPPTQWPAGQGGEYSNRWVYFNFCLEEWQSVHRHAPCANDIYIEGGDGFSGSALRWLFWNNTECLAVI